MLLHTCGRSEFLITSATRHRSHAVIRMSQERLSGRRSCLTFDFCSWKQYCHRQSLLLPLTITTTSSSRCSNSASFKKSSHSRPLSFMLPANSSLFPFKSLSRLPTSSSHSKHPPPSNKSKYLPRSFFNALSSLSSLSLFCDFPSTCQGVPQPFYRKVERKVGHRECRRDGYDTFQGIALHNSHLSILRPS